MLVRRVENQKMDEDKTVVWVDFTNAVDIERAVMLNVDPHIMSRPYQEICQEFEPLTRLDLSGLNLNIHSNDLISFNDVEHLARIIEQDILKK